MDGHRSRGDLVRPHARTYQSKLHPVNLGKVTLKGVNVVRQINSKWADFWATWNWETWVRPQIDVALAAGANCIKVTASGIGPTEDGYAYPDDTTLRKRIEQFVGYVESRGAVVYWNLVAHPLYVLGSGGTLGPTNFPAVQKIAGWLEALPGIVAVDLCNEINNSFPTSWNGPNYAQATTDLQALRDAVRAVTSLPLTASVLCQAVSDITGAWMQAAAPVVDFHDFHPYYTGGTPAVADVTALRAAQWFKGRYLVGENGVNMSQATGARTTWTTQLGQIAALADCFGAVFFCAADYDITAANEFGMYDTNVRNGRSDVLTPFAGWPAKL